MKKIPARNRSFWQGAKVKLYCEFTEELAATGWDRAVERIATGRINSALTARCRSIGAIGEQEAEQEDRIGNIYRTIVVDICCIRTSRFRSLGKEETEFENRIRNVSGSV